MQHSRHPRPPWFGWEQARRTMRLYNETTPTGIPANGEHDLAISTVGAGSGAARPPARYGAPRQLCRPWTSPASQRLPPLPLRSGCWGTRNRDRSPWGRRSLTRDSKATGVLRRPRRPRGRTALPFGPMGSALLCKRLRPGSLSSVSHGSALAARSLHPLRPRALSAATLGAEALQSWLCGCTGLGRRPGWRGVALATGLRRVSGPAPAARRSP